MLTNFTIILLTVGFIFFVVLVVVWRNVLKKREAARKAAENCNDLYTLW